ncbi:hypothetical protein AB0J81_30420, partial [Streptomyces bobili]
MSDRRTEPRVRMLPLVRDLATLDQALYEAVTVTRTPTLDTALRRLSAAADHSKLERHRPFHEGAHMRLERVDVLGEHRLLDLR